MACKTLHGDGYKAIVCTRGARPIKCACGARANLLCDFPIDANGRTCDKGICEEHTTKNGDLDYCALHNSPQTLQENGEPVHKTTPALHEQGDLLREAETNGR